MNFKMIFNVLDGVLLIKRQKMNISKKNSKSGYTNVVFSEQIKNVGQYLKWMILLIMPSPNNQVRCKN